MCCTKPCTFMSLSGLDFAGHLANTVDFQVDVQGRSDPLLRPTTFAHNLRSTPQSRLTLPTWKRSRCFNDFPNLIGNPFVLGGLTSGPEHGVQRAPRLDYVHPSPCFGFTEFGSFVLALRHIL